MGGGRVSGPKASGSLVAIQPSSLAWRALKVGRVVFSKVKQLSTRACKVKVKVKVSGRVKVKVSAVV